MGRKELKNKSLPKSWGGSLERLEREMDEADEEYANAEVLTPDIISRHNKAVLAYKKAKSDRFARERESRWKAKWEHYTSKNETI